MINPTLKRFLTPVVLFVLGLALHQHHVGLSVWLHDSFSMTDAAYTARVFAETLLWFAGVWTLTHAVNLGVVNPLIKQRTGNPAPKILFNLIFAVAMIVTLFAVIYFVFEKPVGGLLATSGLVTVVIGFAIRDMIADFFSGLAMNLERPYQIGDWLEVGGEVGQVTELNWRATRLITLSKKSVIIPNNDLASRQFLNYSKPGRFYRETLDVTLNYTADGERVRNILLAAVLATDGLSDQGEHQIRIKDFSDRGVIYECRFWIEDYRKRNITRHQVASNVLKYLNQAGIAMPYAQTEFILQRNRKPRTEDRINDKRLLSRVAWLNVLTEKELEKLAKVVIEHELEPHEKIIREGDHSSSLFVLVEGVAEVRAKADNGEIEVVGRIEPGQAFGEMSFLTGSPRAATVHALTRVFVLECRRDDFQPIVQARPEIAEQLGRTMAERAIANEQRLLDRTDAETSEDLRSRAKQFAKKISQFFGIH